MIDKRKKLMQKIGWQKIGNHFLKLPMDIINTSEHKKILYNNNNDSVV